MNVWMISVVDYTHAEKVVLGRDPVHHPPGDV